ncbi:hypothetical protein EV666_1421 [Camelimonas lactis]|uniref:Uncharacterized protein n=1 Tax=Camelimonas lactis TaxID=659006 RepID=A0A4R2GFL7_9HYPH|nr:hypothetical protein EV666_1421 [Camelimonas lactis]
MGHINVAKDNDGIVTLTMDFDGKVRVPRDGGH